MADVSKTVEIIFGAKSQVGGVISDLNKQFDSLNTVVDNITEPLAKIGKGVLAADAALAALAVGGMALALKSSSEFNTGFGLISTSITATGDDLARFRGDVLNYATGSVKSISDINAALYTAAQAGVKYTESIEFIRKSEELAVANKANLNTTVDLLTGTMNAYGLKLEDVAHINDVYFQSTLIGKQTIDELGQTMGQVVTIAANSGVSFEELSAAVATLTAKGMETSAAITAVRGVITTFTAPSKEAAEAAAQMGIDLSYAGLHSKGLSGALADVVAKTGGSTEKMIGLFTEMKAMAGVTGLAGDGLKFFNRALDEVKNSTGASEAAYAKMVATFENQTQMIKNQATGLLIELGDKLEPMALKIGSGLSALISGIKVSVDSGAFDPLFAFLGQVTADLGTWMADVGKAFPDAMKNVDFSKLIEAFKSLGEAISEYFGGLDLTDVDDLSSALQTVVDVVTGLINITSGMADAFRPFIETAVEFVKQVASSGTESQDAMGKVVAFAMAIQNLGLGVVAAVRVIDEFKLSISGIFNTLAGGVQIFWNGFQLLIDGIKGAVIIIEGAFLELIDKLTFGLMPGMDDLKASLSVVGEQLSKDLMQNGMDAARGLDRLTTGLGQLSGSTDTAASKTKDFGNALKGVPSKVEPEIVLRHEEAIKRAAEVKDAIEKAIPARKDVILGAQADGSSISEADGIFTKTFPDGRVLLTNVAAVLDGDKLRFAEETLKKTIPDKKTVDIEAKIETAKLKEQSDIIQKSIEWTAKLDIAEVEAKAKIMEAVFSSIDNTIKSTGDTMSSLVGSLADMGQNSQSWDILHIIEDELEMRKGAFEMQKDLVKAQTEVLKKQLSAYESGDGVIKISADGLKPHLEAFMWEILEAIQIKVNQDSGAFLLGLS